MGALEQVLVNDAGGHVLPFMWVHGESHERYAEVMAAIRACGIDQLCVEARPHEDFNGPGWFDDLGFILDEAERLGMGVWLLDDSHFPTGWANGEVQRNHPDLRKRFLRLEQRDAAGPIAGAELSLRYLLADPDDEVLAVLAQRRREDGALEPGTTIDLTPTLHVREDALTGAPAMFGAPTPPVTAVDLDVPAGQWLINVLYTSHAGGEKETEGYLSPIDPAATRVLIDTVYQPMWEHFSEYFGTTFKGFFSDEPRFGNIHGAENASIGRNPQMPLPWRRDLLDLLAERTGTDPGQLMPLLPLLFVDPAADATLLFRGVSHPAVEVASMLRCAYMDLVSDLYAECFDGELCRWCQERGIEKIGHTIEDNNAVARLGYGCGHFFRSMRHSSMAGVDVVMQQLMPGYDDGLYHSFHKPGWDMGFFTHVLARLGGSLAHVDPAKGGRAMAEVFGAYGWNEGNRLALWLVNHLLARGVNHFVPHAFDCADFPDADCLPHLWAGGANPQYPEFERLMGYTQRLSTLLSGGECAPLVGVWFNAESEWYGAYRPLQDVARPLARAGVEHDFVPTDWLARGVVVERDGRALWRCGAQDYTALVVPGGEAVPRAVLAAASEASEAGVPVFFVGAMPERLCEGGAAGAVTDLLASSPAVRVVSTDELAQTVVGLGLRELDRDSEQPWLRCYHYVRDGRHEYLLVNEHPANRVRCSLAGAAEGDRYEYDPWENRLFAAPDAFELDLPPYGSKLVVVSDGPLDAEPQRAPFVASGTRRLGRCEVGFSDDGGRSWSRPVELDEPAYASALPGRGSFAGRVRYVFRFEVGEPDAWRRAILGLEGVQEAATVAVNGVDCGCRLCPDYEFEVTEALKAGENVAEVVLNTTLGRAMGDFCGSFMPTAPAGLTGCWLAME